MAVLSFSIIFRKFSGYPGKGKGVGRKAVVWGRLSQSKGQASQAQHPTVTPGWLTLPFLTFIYFGGWGTVLLEQPHLFPWYVHIVLFFSHHRVFSVTPNFPGA